MKKFIVPTDFSNNAYHAFIYALDLARELNAKVVLCTVYDQPSGVMVDIVDKLKKNSEDDLYAEIQKAKKEGYGDVTIGLRSQRGDVSLAIDRMASLENADLIIMGKTGRSELSNKIFGSNTARTIKDSGHNILVIPEKSKYKAIDEICYATDLRAHSDVDHSYVQCLKPLANIAKTFNAKIEVLHFAKNQEELSEVTGAETTERKEIEAALSDIEHHFSFGVNKDIEDALETHFKNSTYDLICMMKHDYNWVKKIFAVSPTTEIAYSTKIPLLILH